MNADWVTIKTDSGLYIQINPETVTVDEDEDSNQLSCDVMVYTKDGKLINEEHTDEVNELVSKFFNEILENAIKDT